MSRVRYADDECAAAGCAGVDQIVLLGSGFDTTSLRAQQGSMTIYEVDAPSTLADKQAAVTRFRGRENAPQVVWVPCDFEHDALQDRLRTSGFDSTRPSIIVWMGVTYYLTRTAIDATLTDLAALCAPGSQLVFDYTDPDVINQSTRWAGARRVARAVERTGEPFRTGFTATDLDAALTVHGFSCREHLRAPALIARYRSTRDNPPTDDWLAVAAAQRVQPGQA